jgi:hypothetical protein
LLDAKCALLQLDKFYCSNSHSNATGDYMFSNFQSYFCDSYFNATESIVTLVLGSSLLIAFLLNAVRLVYPRFRYSRASKSSGRSESLIIMSAQAAPLKQCASPREQQAAVGCSLLDLGSLGSFLPYFGMQWIAAISTRSRQVQRAAFLVMTVVLVVFMLVRLNRMYLARWDLAVFMATYNECSALCNSAGIGSCPKQYPIKYNCQDVSTSSATFDFFECFQAQNYSPLLNSGLAVNSIMLSLPLHSAVACVFLWSFPANPVLSSLRKLRALSHLSSCHQECVSATTKFMAVPTFALLALCISLTRILSISEQTACNSSTFLSCPIVSNRLIIFVVVCEMVLNVFLSLAPVMMMVLYILIAFIVRIRMRAFVTIYRFVAECTLEQKDGAGSSYSSDFTPTARDVLDSLHLCQCPDDLLSKMSSFLLNETRDCRQDAARIIKSRLQMLWMLQLRDLKLLSKFGDKWLLVQAFVFLSTLLPLAAYCTLASLYPVLLPRVLIILCSLALFFLPLIAAFLALALASFYVEQACKRMLLLLHHFGVAQNKDNEFCPIFDGQDSLSATASFCSFSSQSTFAIFGVSIDWMSLLRFLYYMGLLVWVVSTSVLPKGILKTSGS